MRLELKILGRYRELARRAHRKRSTALRPAIRWSEFVPKLRDNWFPCRIRELQLADVSPVDLSQLFEQSRSRISGLKWNDSNLCAKLFQQGTFVWIQCFRGVITSLYINGRTRGRNEFSCHWLAEYRYEVNAGQSGQHFSAISLVGHRA